MGKASRRENREKNQQKKANRRSRSPEWGLAHHGRHEIQPLIEVCAPGWSREEDEAIAFLLSSHIDVQRDLSGIITPGTQALVTEAFTDLIETNNEHYGLRPIAPVLGFDEGNVPVPFFDVAASSPAFLAYKVIGRIREVCDEMGQTPTACAIAALPEIYPNPTPAVVFCASVKDGHQVGTLREKRAAPSGVACALHLSGWTSGLLLEMCRLAVGLPTPLDELVLPSGRVRAPR